MQAATGITEPDYGVIFDDTVFESGADDPGRPVLQRADRGGAGVRAEASRSPGRTARSTTCSPRPTTPSPALEMLNSHIELEGRTIVDTITDNAALGGDGARRDAGAPGRRSTCAGCRRCCYRNGEIEETGVAAGVLGHPATGRRLAGRTSSHRHGDAAGGRRDHPRRARSPARCGCTRGDTVRCDYGPMGVITCRFSLNPTFRDALRGGRPSARRHLGVLRAARSSPRSAPAPGMDWVLIDMEHAPNGLESVLAQLQAVSAYPVDAGRARADRRRR